MTAHVPGARRGAYKSAAETHYPHCNDRCDGTEHYLGARDPRSAEDDGIAPDPTGEEVCDWCHGSLTKLADANCLNPQHRDQTWREVMTALDVETEYDLPQSESDATASVGRVRTLLASHEHTPCTSDCPHLECRLARAVLAALDGVEA